ncbi:alginate export family protein [uncultured Sphingomonas sp.]|uniref:alginate export family protein n=1 Tax=uncultured Sphingomonas sp. TaxID=158754 RepID=UPI0035CB6DF9
MRARAPLPGGLICCVLATAATAQTVPDTEGRFRLSATERVRYELIDGQARAGFNESDDLLNFRTTVLAEYDAAPVKLAAELWDSRVYRADRGTPVTTNEVNALELVQAFAEVALGDVAGPGSKATVQAGRFMLNLGSRRLVAADDYRNTTNGYTGLHATLATKVGWRATAIYTLPQQRRPDDLDALLDNEVAVDREGSNLVLWGGLASRARAIGPATVEMSFFHLGERDRPGRPTRDRSLNTAALRVIRDPAPGRFDLEVEGIVQRGRASASTAAVAVRQPVAAWFLHADAGYTFAGGWKPRVSVEYDHASGDGRGGRYGRFDTLLGMRRADLAPAGLYNAIARTNIASPGVRVEATPDRRTDLFLSYRPMWLASRFDAFSSTGVRDASGRSGNFAGHQIDGRVRHRLSRTLMLEADVVLLAKGRFLRDAPNAPPGHWTRYVSFNAVASF